MCASKKHHKNAEKEFKFSNMNWCTTTTLSEWRRASIENTTEYSDDSQFLPLPFAPFRRSRVTRSTGCLILSVATFVVKTKCLSINKNMLMSLFIHLFLFLFSFFYFLSRQFFNLFSISTRGLSLLWMCDADGDSSLSLPFVMTTEPTQASAIHRTRLTWNWQFTACRWTMMACINA